MVHQSGQVDVVRQHTLSVIKLTLLFFSSTVTEPRVHCLILEEVVTNEDTLLILRFLDHSLSPMPLKGTENFLLEH